MWQAALLLLPAPMMLPAPRNQQRSKRAVRNHRDCRVSMAVVAPLLPSGPEGFRPATVNIPVLCQLASVFEPKLRLAVADTFGLVHETLKFCGMELHRLQSWSSSLASKKAGAIYQFSAVIRAQKYGQFALF